MKFGRYFWVFTTVLCLLLGADSCQKNFEAPSVGMPDTGGGEEDSGGNNGSGSRNTEFVMLFTNDFHIRDSQRTHCAHR